MTRTKAKKIWKKRQERIRARFVEDMHKMAAIMNVSYHKAEWARYINDLADK